MPRQLTELPSELIADIIEHVDNRETLVSLAGVCSELRNLTEPVLYRSILQRTGAEAVRLQKAIKARPCRARWLHTIDSRCKFSKREGLISMASVIMKARSLKELTIESPYCNRTHGDEYDHWKTTMYQMLCPLSTNNNAPFLPHLRKCMLALFRLVGFHEMS